MTRKLKKKLIKIRSWKESLKQLIKTRDNAKDVFSEALSRGRDSRRQPPCDSDLGERFWLEPERSNCRNTEILFSEN